MTDSIAYKDWKCKKMNNSFLRKNGLKYFPSEELYIYRFPLDTYKNYIVLDCKITINLDGNVKIDVFTENEDYFSQFYNPTNKSYEEYINHINKQILDKFQVFHIQETKRKRRTKKK